MRSAFSKLQFYNPLQDGEMGLVSQKQNSEKPQIRISALHSGEVRKYYIDKLLSVVGTCVQVCLHVGAHVDRVLCVVECVCVCIVCMCVHVCFMHLCVSLCVCGAGGAGHNIDWISYQGSQSNILGNAGVDGP